MTIQKSHKHVTYFPAQQLYKHSIGFVMPPPPGGTLFIFISVKEMWYFLACNLISRHIVLYTLYT